MGLSALHSQILKKAMQNQSKCIADVLLCLLSVHMHIAKAWLCSTFNG